MGGFVSSNVDVLKYAIVFTIPSLLETQKSSKNSSKTSLGDQIKPVN